MHCRLCGEYKKLVKSHIVPRSWHAPLKRSNTPILKLSGDRSIYPKATHAGEYDTGILCAHCDSSFSIWEEYAGRLIFKDLSKYKIKDCANGRRYYVIQEYDYVATKLCLLSILWRMSISKRTSFNKVRLGQFESQIRDMILRKEAGDPNKFATCIWRYEDEIGSNTMIDSHPERVEGINVYNVGLPGIIAVIKVDRRPANISLAPFVLSPNIPLCIPLRQVTEGNEWSAFKHIIERNHRK